MNSADEQTATPQPHETQLLFGHVATETLLLDAFRSGRMHHALMLAGPKGIGKATLAFRFARFLLANPDSGSADVSGATDLTAPSDSPSARQVTRLAHPDLRVLSPTLFDEENRSGEIKVPHVRQALKSLLTTAGAGGWRICVVDAADDLNRNSANALLKALEEPPAQALFVLVCHRPGKLLRTIRSRCMRIDMQPLDADHCRRALLAADPNCKSDPNLDALISMGEGSPGETLRFRRLDAVDLAGDIAALMQPGADLEALHKLADAIAPARADDRFRLFMDLTLERIASHIRRMADEPDDNGLLEPWLGLWDKINDDYAATLALNLDRKHLILNSFFGIEAALRESR